MEAPVKALRSCYTYCTNMMRHYNRACDNSCMYAIIIQFNLLMFMFDQIFNYKHNEQLPTFQDQEKTVESM